MSGGSSKLRSVDGGGTQEAAPSIVEAGIYPGMADKWYRDAEGLNQSGLSQYVNSFNPDEDRKGLSPRKLMIRSCFHACVLEPEAAKELYFVTREDYKLNTTEGKAGLDAEEAEHPGKIGIKPSERVEIGQLVTSVKKSKDAQRVLDASEMREAACFAELHPGVMSKGLIDIVCPNSNWDLKSTYCKNKEEFEQSIVGYRYDVQSAYYTDLFAAASGEERWKNWGWIVVSTRNLDCWVTVADARHYQTGRRWYRDMLPIWAKGTFNG